MEEKDVTQDSSPETQEVVNEPVADQQVGSIPEQETNEQTQTEVGKNSVDYDDSGVPWKNRAMEYKRKFESLETKFDSLSNKITQNFQQPQTQRKPTIEELEYYAANNPEYAAIARAEIAKLQKEEIQNTIRSEVESFKKSQEVDRTKQMTYNEVINRYPEIVIKDSAGNIIGYNEQSPLYQGINYYLSDPEIRNNPRGLKVAAALAYQDLTMRNAAKTQVQINNQKAQIKNLQKQTLIEGAGKPVVPEKSDSDKLSERFRQTGSLKDAQAILKQRYLNKNK